MKKFKEFLIMFIPYTVLGIIWFCYFAFQFEWCNNILEFFESIVNNHILMYALFFTYVPSTLAALVLTTIFAIVFKRKKELLGRIKYYIFLFLVAIIATFIICAFILIGTWDIVFKTICILQVAIAVVFIHWIIEYISEKIKSKRQSRR